MFCGDGFVGLALTIVARLEKTVVLIFNLLALVIV